MVARGKRIGYARPMKQNGRGRTRRRAPRNPPATRSMGEIVLAPGVGRVPRSPFGSYRGVNLRCWDAFDTAHAPLPRSVGPYAVVRTTRVFPCTEKYMIFGTARALTGSSREKSSWSNTIAFGSSSDTSNINGSGSTNIYNITAPGATVGDNSTITVVPAAMSVQVMNPNPLNDTNGIVYAAVCPTQLSLDDNTRTWLDFANEFTAYMRPRLMSAPKLALRGIQMNSYPLNMSELSDFQTIQNFSDGPITWKTSVQAPGSSQFLTGLAPMVVVNSNQQNLTYAVTVEYRVRFDLSNPAVSSHKHHGITSDVTWDKMQKAAIALGNGVRDIADIVATAGQAARAIRGPQAPMLVD